MSVRDDLTTAASHLRRALATWCLPDSSSLAVIYLDPEVFERFEHEISRDLDLVMVAPNAPTTSLMQREFTLHGIKFRKRLRR